MVENKKNNVIGLTATFLLLDMGNMDTFLLLDMGNMDKLNLIKLDFYIRETQIKNRLFKRPLCVFYSYL
jgi:hypothetical protein